MGSPARQNAEFLTDIYNSVYDFSERFKIKLQFARLRPPALPGITRFAQLKENIETLSEGTKKLIAIYSEQVNLYDTYVDHQFKEFLQTLIALERPQPEQDTIEQKDEDHLIINAKIQARLIDTDEAFESGAETAEEEDSIDEYITRTISDNIKIWNDRIRPEIERSEQSQKDLQELAQDIDLELQTEVLEVLVPQVEQPIDEIKITWHESKERINRDRILIAQQQEQIRRLQEQLNNINIGMADFAIVSYFTTLNNNRRTEVRQAISKYNNIDFKGQKPPVFTGDAGSYQEWIRQINQLCMAHGFPRGNDRLANSTSDINK
jgi:hypothetical protein